MHLEVVTPKGIVLAHEQVDEVVAPGLLGEVGILPGHIPFLTALRPGVLRWHASDTDGTLAVGGGYLEVRDDGSVIALCDMATEGRAIDVAEATRELERIEQQLKGWSGSTISRPALSGDVAGAPPDGDGEAGAAKEAGNPDGGYSILVEQRDWARARVMAAKWK